MALGDMHRFVNANAINKRVRIQFLMIKGLTITTEICFARKFSDLQISPFFNHDLHNFHIFWWLNCALIDL